MCKLMNSSLGRSRFADKHKDRASWGGSRGRLSREGPASPRAAARGCLSLQSEGERPSLGRSQPHSVLRGPPPPEFCPPATEVSAGRAYTAIALLLPTWEAPVAAGQDREGSSELQGGPEGWGVSSTPGQTNVPRGSHLQSLNKTGCRGAPQERVWGFEAPFRVRGGKGPDRRVPSLPPDPAPVLGNCAQTCHNQSGKE